jgi:histidinol-phosphate phosphatase family protein
VKAVVIAGGKGTRLGLNDIPKAMVPVDGVPLLERIVKMAVRDGFRDLIFLNGHLSHVIEQHFGDGRQFGANITHVVESEPLGTAGCFNQIRSLLTEPFLVLYGDTLMDVDLRAFSGFAFSRPGAGALFVHPNDHPFDSDLVECDDQDRVIAFHPKPRDPATHHPNLVNAALYALTPAALDFVPKEGASDWGRDVLSALSAQMPVYGYRSCEYIKDVGTPDRLERAERHYRGGRLERLALRNSKPALFLDRDGVINEERDGVFWQSNVRLIDGAADAIRLFNDAGIPVICVTNQPGLAKGFLGWQDMRDVIGEIDHQLAEQAGAYLDDIIICPHHPEKGWPGEVAELKIDCDCRKPKDGMLRRAQRAHNIDLGASWMVGDRYCDVAAASAAGVSSVLVRTGYAGHDRDKYNVQATFETDDLAVAGRRILELMQ